MVSVAEGREPHYVLESFHKSFVADSELVETFVGWDVSYQVGVTSGSL